MGINHNLYVVPLKCDALGKILPNRCSTRGNNFIVDFSGHNARVGVPIQVRNSYVLLMQCDAFREVVRFWASHQFRCPSKGNGGPNRDRNLRCWYCIMTVQKNEVLLGSPN